MDMDTVDLSSRMPGSGRIEGDRVGGDRVGGRLGSDLIDGERRVFKRREPLWRDLIGEVLRYERQAQDRTLQDVADAARISMPYLSELERGRKEASSEILAATARALGLKLSDLIDRAHVRLGEYETYAAEPAYVAQGSYTESSTTRASMSAAFGNRDAMCLAA